MRNSGISSPATTRPTPAPRPSPHSRKRFALVGRRHQVDPRVDAARGDLADIRLVDRVFASHYAAAVSCGVLVQAPLRAGREGDAPALSEVLVGETFDVLELAGDHAWGVGGVDGTVGFVARAALGGRGEPTHVVAAPRIGALPMGSRIDGTDADPALRRLDDPVADYVALAEALIGVPAVAGGRSGAGVDAPGLVFLTLSLAGIVAPRFADLQAAALGHPVGEDAPMLRGDVLLYAGHAAIVAGDGYAIHVTDRVVREAVDAIAGFGPPVARRRLP